MLSRILGRKHDLTNNLTQFRPSINTGKRTNLLHLITDDQLKNEYKAGKRSLDELCWVESHECWVCDRWSYFIPMITEKEIMGCIEDDPERPYKEGLSKITPAQRRTFDNLCRVQ